MILATYLPFYRIHEITTYFTKNIEILKPKNAIVYIDNIFHEKQKEIVARAVPETIEVRFGNWRNRNNTWTTMLRDFREFNDEVVVVDSDNLVEQDLPEIHRNLSKYPIYGIIDEEAWSRGPHHFLARSRKIGELEINGAKKPIYAYKVYEGSIRGLFRGGSVFFIGPKQVLGFSRLPDPEIIDRVERALNRVDPWLRNFISDETLLGVIAHLMGIREVPWTIGSHHMHHGSTLGKATELLVAAAHFQFGRGLVREFGLGEFRRYMFKYLMSIGRNLGNVVG